MDFVNPSATAGLNGDPYSTVAWAFQNAWNIAQQKSATSDSVFKSAATAAGSAPTMSPAPFVFTPDVHEPNVTIPTDAQGASVAKFYELSQAVINQLAGLFEGYMVKYFPNDTPYLHDAEAWIVKALTQGGTGINADIEAQIWERDRSRILKEASKAELEVMTTWAARRYPLPPGAAAAQVLSVRKDASDKITESSRALAIKNMEIEIENAKFAVDQSIKLYGAAMGAATEYVKALSVGPASGMQIIPSITDSQSKLIGAASEYYRSRISVEELKLKAATVPAEYSQQARTHNAEWVMKDIELKVNAAIAAAQSMGTQAAAALNSLHAQAGVSGSSSRTASNNVQFSYSNDTASAGPTVSSV